VISGTDKREKKGRTLNELMWFRSILMNLHWVLSFWIKSTIKSFPG